MEPLGELATRHLRSASGRTCSSASIQCATNSGDARVCLAECCLGLAGGHNRATALLWAVNYQDPDHRPAGAQVLGLGWLLDFLAALSTFQQMPVNRASQVLLSRSARASGGLVLAHASKI